MRVAGAVDVLELPPGGTGEVPLDVVNTSSVIDGVTATVHGTAAPHASATPAVLPLFPDSTGRVTVRFALPDTFPAGRHHVRVDVRGGATGELATHDLDVVVGPRPHLALSAAPRVVRAHRHATFELFARNDGNTPLDVTLRATDADRSLRCRLTPSAVTIGPGTTEKCEVRVRGPRHLLGGDLERSLDVEAAVAGHDLPERERRVNLVLRQAPQLSRGLVTAAVLFSVVALWAGAFLFGLRAVLTREAPVKQPAASFFLGSREPGQANAAALLTSAGGGAPGAAQAPGGVVAKDAALGAGVGGALAGTVSAASDNLGVGRITVTAYRRARTGLLPVGSSATQTDGTYRIEGLFPGDYLLRYSATGYRPLWYPAVQAPAAARPVSVGAQEVADGLDAIVTGLPAVIRGTVDLGDAKPGATATVTARATWTPDDKPLEFSTTTAADGTYTLTDLPAPGTYQIGILATGYRPATLTEHVSGGQTRFAAAATLGRGDGTIRGVVRGLDGLGVGGVDIATSIGDTPIHLTTPTAGAIGAFTLAGLPTPGTYILTFGKPGYVTATRPVDLAAGQALSGLTITLAGSRTTIEGTVIGPGSDTTLTGLGGATVAALGGADTVTTTTATSGDVGAFVLTALDPRTTKLTVSLPGYVTVVVDVPPGASNVGKVTLRRATATIRGTLTTTCEKASVEGAAVVATDGRTRRTAIAGSKGTFTFGALPAGTYSVTAVDGGCRASGVAVLTRGQSLLTLDLVLARE